MLGIDDWLMTLPPILVFTVVGVVIMLESMGIPLPGEITLISASLLAAAGGASIWGVAIGAAVGAIIGDSIGYYIGHRGGRPLLERLGRRFPKHFGPRHLARAERVFARWGVWAVFFGRFVALLRILAGPLAGALRVPYRKFLIANATGGVVWAFGTAFAIYFTGHVAERYLKDFSWILLAVAIAFGLGTTAYLRRRAARADAQLAADPEVEPSPDAEIAAIAVHAATDAPVAALRSLRPATAAAHAASSGTRTGRPDGSHARKPGRHARRPPRPRG
jgi:membrane protein DedA with SNARE-associated domain